MSEEKTQPLILEPGVYSDISFKDYLALPYISNSYLGRLDHCPASALVELETTPAMAFGRATHALVLEGQEAFDKSFAVLPECDRRTKAGKQLYADFVLANADKEVVKAADYETIKAMRVAVAKHPAAAEVLKVGISEQTVIWRDKTSGLLCKARLDRSPEPDTRTLIDYKTAESADENAFFNKAYQYGSFRQAGHYLDGVNSHIEDKDKYFDEFLFVVAEKKPPYRVEVYRVDADLLNWGISERDRLIRLELKCRDDEHYPHYQSPGIETLYRTHWM